MNTPNRQFRRALLLAGIALWIASSVRLAQPFQIDVACNEPALPDTFFSRGDVVWLRVSVTDADHRPITCLTREDFQVREDGQLQTISAFSYGDLPVTVGLVVDTGRSMAARHTDIAAAGFAFARSSGIENEFFALAFNDTVHDLLSPDLPFTHQPAVLHEALLQAPMGGRSALHDAVAHGLDYATRGRLDHRALIVMTASRDTASRSTFAQLLGRVAASPTVIYPIGILGPQQAEGELDALRRLAALSGGEAFFADDPSELPSILERIARDIRTSYTIGYVPPSAHDGAKFRDLQVTLTRATHPARLRYRDGYAGGSR